MTFSKSDSFSTKWMFTSLFIFIAIELFLGGFVGEHLVGRYMSMNLRFLLQGILNLISYFIGGFVIGLISPGVRTLEPAIGAFLSVATMLCLSFFTPYSFIHFSMTKMIIGGGIAFFLASYGAKMGEKLAGNKV